MAMTEIADTKGQFQIGTQFIGNINKVPMQIVAIKAWEGCLYHGIQRRSPVAYIMDMETKRIFRYGLRALEHCDVTIIKKENEYACQMA